MTHARALLIALAALAALTSPAARAAQAAPLPSECAGIDLRTSERLESQGFLGMLTPDADWKVVRGALEDAQILENARKNALANGLGWNAFQGTLPPRLRARKTWEQTVADDFRLAQLCVMARQRGVKRLTLACVGDTHSGEGQEHATGVFGRETQTGDWVDAECFVSTYSGGDNPSIAELRQAQWGKSASASEYTSPMSRHDALADPDFRRGLYADLIREAVSGIAPYRLPSTPPAPAGCATPPGSPLDAGVLPVNSSLPAATSSSHSPY